MKLYLGNLSPSTTDTRLNELLKPFGSPTPVEVIKDKMTGQSRGFAFVEFKNDAEARAAIAGLNGKEVDGSVLKVNEARQKPQGGR
ncbi:MAG TPA: RNA-binding protein [Thermoanaerobaculia bacterium]|nr:RNA-binding protein [Thermoanaerobaculia bacterium]